MTDAQLDTAYTALANAIARTQGLAPRTAPDTTQLFLATLALSLIAQQADATQCLALIAQAEQLAAS